MLSNTVALIQVIAINAVVFACIMTKNTEWIVPLVAIIVGLHFLPFAAMFQWPVIDGWGSP